MTRLARGLGACVLTTGGSLVGFGVAVGVRVRFLSAHPDIYPKPMPFPAWLSDVAGSQTDLLPLRIWLFGTVAAFVLAALWGARGEPHPGRAAIVRVFGAALGGAALIGLFWVFARWNLPTPTTDTDVAAMLPIVMGVGLLFAGLVTLATQKPPLEVPTGPEGAGGFLPAPVRRAKEHASSYSLVATRPPLSADEVERAALALEVRVLWGGDLLSVRHLVPPRRFCVGSDASDLPVERPPEAGDLVLVEVDGARVAVAKGGVRVPLELGARVSLTLGARGAGGSYRAEQTDLDYEGQPLVFDIGLVRAGRVVGRRPSLQSLRDPLRVLASVGLVACGTFALFRHAASEHGPDVDEDGVRRDDKLYITQKLIAIDDRTEAENAEYEDDYWWQSDWRERAWRSRHRGSDIGEGWWWLRWTESAAFREDAPFLSLELQAGNTTCDPRLERAPEPACVFGVVTPYGLRGIGATLGPDPLGRGTQQPMLLDRQHPWGLAAPFEPVHLASRGRVHIRPANVMNYRQDQVLRVVRQHQAEFRECYERELTKFPVLAGRLTVRLIIDPEGNTSNIGNGGRYDLPNAKLVSCVVRAFHGLSFPPPERGIATIYVPIDFAPR
jgi:hypothetical protein